MRESSPYAGQTVQLKNGYEYDVVDWYELAAGRTWKAALADGDPRAESYNVRHGMAGLPDDDDVLLGRMDGIMQITHVTELRDYVAPAPVPGGTGARDVSPSEIGEMCVACDVALRAGDKVAVIKLGPGPDPSARDDARNGRPYDSLAMEIHWACATGDEQYVLED